MYADERSEDAGERRDQCDGGSVPDGVSDASGVPIVGAIKREVIHREPDILRSLPVAEVFVDSDGYRYVCAYLGGSPGDEYDSMAVGLVLGLAKRLPLTLRVKYNSWWPKIVWIDQEYVSLDFRPEGFYYVAKRKELGL